MKKKFFEKTTNAFTLIELLAVLIILAVILAIIIPVTNGVINNSRQNAYETQIDLLKDQALKYSINNDLGTQNGITKQLQFNQLLTAGIISELPTNPLTSETLEGCILYTWKDEIKQYYFEYSETCKVPEIVKNPMIRGADFNEIFTTLSNGKTINSIVFEGTIDSNVDINSAIDLSLNQDKSIIGFLDNNTFRIQTNGIILAHNDLGDYWNPETFESKDAMFQNLYDVTSINFKDNGINIFDTSQVTDMGYMFSETKVETLDLSGFDTSNVTDMSAMFKYSSLKSLDVSSFDTSNVVLMLDMFLGSTQLQNLNLDNFVFSDTLENYFMLCDVPNNEELAKQFYEEGSDGYWFVLACSGG